jgi:hypothetical protein
VRIKARYGDNWPVFCALLAAFSANQSVRGNVSLAKRNYERYINDEPLIGLRQSCANFSYWLDTGQLRGTKINAFYRALIGHTDSIPVDRWMLRWYFGRQYHKSMKPTPFRIAQVTGRVAILARDRKIACRDMQAIIWCQTIRAAGRMPQSFADYI